MENENMGKQRVKDMTISPLEVLRAMQTGSITIAQAQQMFNGVIPIGDYKGVAALLNLDLLVKQPLVDAELKHILGIIDGREEDYDLQTLAVTAAEAIGTIHTGALTVPTGEVWFINNVQTTIPASGGANIITANWHCSLWTDRVAASALGQPFHAAALNFGVGGGAQLDEFSPPGPVWLLTNKQVALRAPAGTIFTVVFTNTGVVAAATVNCVFQLYGWIGKALVD